MTKSNILLYYIKVPVGEPFYSKLERMSVRNICRSQSWKKHKIKKKQRHWRHQHRYTGTCEDWRTPRCEKHHDYMKNPSSNSFMVWQTIMIAKMCTQEQFVNFAKTGIKTMYVGKNGWISAHSHHNNWSGINAYTVDDKGAIVCPCYIIYNDLLVESVHMSDF